MGKGAFVKIGNVSDQSVTVSYSSMNCMYDGGDENSNFAPITGVIKSGDALPPNGAQYIEAKASGGCAFEASTFNMDFSVGSSSASLAFKESNNNYSVNGSNAATITVGGLNVWAALWEPDDQFRIMVLISN